MWNLKSPKELTGLKPAAKTVIKMMSPGTVREGGEVASDKRSMLWAAEFAQKEDHALRQTIR